MAPIVSHTTGFRYESSVILNKSRNVTRLSTMSVGSTNADKDPNRNFLELINFSLSHKAIIILNL